MAPGLQCAADVRWGVGLAWGRLGVLPEAAALVASVLSMGYGLAPWDEHPEGRCNDPGVDIRLHGFRFHTTSSSPLLQKDLDAA